ncbi:lipoprotein signal peptidase [Sinisalibacter lacisalsi]|uniref:Lipoprotein signal peptidase n=2 Tax=Sinisalibacter lacisalsi TaxID=1526570 RepID=A0ABQ1Q9P9_9RHOB|nr:lipoprotein signal peptidase [Sinisalibacter lacisalsi]
MITTAAITFALDQIIKVWVVHLLDLKTRLQIDVWPPYLTLRMAWNRGVNFGLGASDSDVMRWVLIAVALAISAWVVWWVHKDAMGRLGQVFAGLLLGGAIGNVIDRLLYGAVADFLNMTCCGIANPWSFNIADAAIFVGAIGLVLFTGEKSRPKTP